MTDAELRALVRAAVARHLNTSDVPVAPAAGERRATTADPANPSHHLYVALVNVGDACVIEPTVSCDHCGYCRSHGY